MPEISLAISIGRQQNAATGGDTGAPDFLFEDDVGFLFEDGVQFEFEN